MTLDATVTARCSVFPNSAILAGVAATTAFASFRLLLLSGWVLRSLLVIRWRLPVAPADHGNRGGSLAKSSFSLLLPII